MREESSQEISGKAVGWHWVRVEMSLEGKFPIRRGGGAEKQKAKTWSKRGKEEALDTPRRGGTVRGGNAGEGCAI